MTAKLIALYKQPEDPAAFDEKYFGEHVPLVEKIPGIQKTVVNRVKRAVAGESFHLVVEMHFADYDALKAAMKTPEMAATGDHIGTFGGHLMTLLMVEED